MPTNSAPERSGGGGRSPSPKDHCCQVPLCPFPLLPPSRYSTAGALAEAWNIRRNDPYTLDPYTPRSSAQRVYGSRRLPWSSHSLGVQPFCRPLQRRTGGPSAPPRGTSGHPYEPILERQRRRAQPGHRICCIVLPQAHQTPRAADRCPRDSSRQAVDDAVVTALHRRVRAGVRVRYFIGTQRWCRHLITDAPAHIAPRPRRASGACSSWPDPARSDRYAVPAPSPCPAPGRCLVDASEEGMPRSTTDTPGTSAAAAPERRQAAWVSHQEQLLAATRGSSRSGRHRHASRCKKRSPRPLALCGAHLPTRLLLLLSLRHPDGLATPLRTKPQPPHSGASAGASAQHRGVVDGPSTYGGEPESLD
jgi:hypothetical protein